MVPTEEFNVCKELNDWKGVQVPRLAMKLSCSYLDKFLWDIKVKKGVKMNEIVKTVQSIVLLKTATVGAWGNDFLSHKLEAILPSSIPRKEILPCLKLLEKGDLIEIVDESDPKKIHCRFNHIMFKDAIY